MDNGEKTNWDIKKIVVGVLILGVIGWALYQNKERILEYNKQPVQAVAGVSVEKKQNDNASVAIPKFDIQQKISDITNQVSNLNAAEVAASSPQIQKVLKDMEGLKSLPQNQVKDACIKICSSL